MLGTVWVRMGAVALAMQLSSGFLEPPPLEAQDWSWPDRAQNLTELPADFPPERLSAVMRGFSGALGVRCSHCHVGEEGEPLSTYDFASDANPNKDVARAMYRMLGVINDHLDGVEPSGDPVNMWCHTCHAGKPRPQTLGEAVQERYAAEGGRAALDYFSELRERYFGAAAYDFTAASVDQLGSSFAAQGDTAVAHRLFEINLEAYPLNAQVQERMGDAWLARSDTTRALQHYERSLLVRPDEARVVEKIERLGGR